MKTSLVLNSGHGIRKSKVKTKIWCVHNVNAKGFYYKNVIKIIRSWQWYIPKNGVKQIENNEEFFIYLNPLGRQLIFFEKPSNLHVAHVYLCVAHIHPCVNYERIKTPLKMN
jgi:hypothetical protein